MNQQKITKIVLQKVYRPVKDSHKGENGRLLIIAGSKKYHGAMFLCAAMAAKIVDFVYLHTTVDNFELVRKVRHQLAEFIYINERDLAETIKEVDTILVGPGLMPDKKTGRLVNGLLKKYPDKKILLDAGALRVLKPELLNSNCVITPHQQEFFSIFRQKSSVEVAGKISLICPAVIVLKGSIDYVIQHGQVFFNTTGNAGMTKGGTGDVLAGLMAGLMTKTDCLSAAKQAVYVNGRAGDSLYKRFGFYYSATELIPMAQKILADKIF